MRLDSTDVLNDFWLSLLQDAENLPEFQNSRQMRGYLKRRAARQVVKQTRRHVYCQARSVRREERLACPPESSHTIQEAAPSSEADETLLAAVAAVTSELAPLETAVVQAKIEQKSNREVARALGVDEGTVRRALRRVSHMLARNMAKSGGVH
jgi:RNA polymerase sigma factor (sigma-70 family)